MRQNRNVLESPPHDQSAESDSAEEGQFERGGYIRRNFHESPTWREAYERVAEVSRRFVASAWPNGREGYAWPLDPLHDWSRVWEYPFVAEQLRRNGCEEKGLKLLDVGAAATFFTFYLLRHGFQVTNLDYDPSMPGFFDLVFERVSQELEVNVRPTYVIADARDTKLPAESFDVVTCISVLEHIPHWERALVEINRLLRPGGLFILTFDVRISGPVDAPSEDDARRLLGLLSEMMDLTTTLEESIPADALTPHNGSLLAPGGKQRKFRRYWPPTAIVRKVVRRLRGQSVRQVFCVYGGVWRKR